MNSLNIISGHEFRMMVATMPKYEMDLGRAYTKKDEVKGIVEKNIKDEFVLLFLKESGRCIYKVGRMGPINFYSYDNIAHNEIWVYKDGERIVKEFDKNLAILDFKKYFASLIWELRDV